MLDLDALIRPEHPARLVALWLYATIDGVGSAREIERLCTTEHAYRWQCGGGVNQHAWRRIMPTPAARLLNGARCRIECLLAHNLLCAARLRAQAV